jgi:hypothetical protein
VVFSVAVGVLLIAINSFRFTDFCGFVNISSINLFLEQLNLGDCTIRGNLEAFSCNKLGTCSIASFVELHAFDKLVY